MLRLSKMTDYALVIMHYLASHDKELKSANHVATKVGLGLPTVSKILKLLVVAGLVQSVRGSAGGYKLERPADQISLTEVIAVLEGTPALTDCSHEDRNCEFDATCGIRDNWIIVNKIVMQTLEKISLADMLQPLCQQTLLLKGIPIELEANHAGGNP